MATAANALVVDASEAAAILTWLAAGSTYRPMHWVLERQQFCRLYKYEPYLERNPSWLARGTRLRALDLHEQGWSDKAITKTFGVTARAMSQ